MNLTLDLDFSTPAKPITCPADIPSEWLAAMAVMVQPEAPRERFDLLEMD